MSYYGNPKEYIPEIIENLDSKWGGQGKPGFDPKYKPKVTEEVLKIYDDNVSRIKEAVRGTPKIKAGAFIYTILRNHTTQRKVAEATECSLNSIGNKAKWIEQDLPAEGLRNRVERILE